MEEVLQSNIVTQTEQVNFMTEKATHTSNVAISLRCQNESKRHILKQILAEVPYLSL